MGMASCHLHPTSPVTSWRREFLLTCLYGPLGLARGWLGQWALSDFFFFNMEICLGKCFGACLVTTGLRGQRVGAFPGERLRLSRSLPLGLSEKF